MDVSTATAARWVERWERQQQLYAVDREERFEVIADLVEHVTRDCPAPLVLDLGSGPGCLAARLAGRLPTAEVLAVDADPLLLELGSAHYGSALRYVRTLIGAPGWLDTLDLARPADAVVSTTALHYLGTDTLRRVYRELAGLLRPGGILINGDHISPDSTKVSELAVDIGRRRAARSAASLTEDWESWWSSAATDPELAPLLSRRDDGGRPHCEGNDLTLSGHVTLLRDAGFEHVGAVWQVGPSHVLAAVR
ncbi:class I SAM-dependent methyltransferase [Streptomyces europaeiscabiei]|uniref:class I SAM-dependent methyltransferase n=1 Tax=Streptomyces europaeiscabiei TaxID=146819 RepID=UPI0029AED898|nr:class I SAM-dependent methyltransferase [Streptomyces europaeiscabiei]MDX3695633.1 class I SAM-dependent methyltransferase [Streptomyces europaeiscabiei]